MGNKGARNRRKYLISLAERQSMLALVAGLIVFFCTMAAIIIWAESFDPTDEQPLHYFTALSNLVSAIAAAFMIPYAVEGIRKKHFMLPRYIVLFQFAAATWAHGRYRLQFLASCGDSAVRPDPLPMCGDRHDNLKARGHPVPDSVLALHCRLLHNGCSCRKGERRLV